MHIRGLYILKEIRSLSFIYTFIKTRDNLIELRGCHSNYKDKNTGIRLHGPRVIPNGAKKCSPSLCYLN